MAKQVSNGKSVVEAIRFSSRADEEAQALALSERLGLPFVDLPSFRVDADLFRSIPADLMLRYGFVP